MSRSGYTEDGDDDGMLNLWRGNVARAIRGKRGQAFLREMATALDAMPVKELHDNVLVEDSKIEDSKHVCAIGSVAVARGLDVSKLDVYDGEEVGQAFGIAKHLAQEIAYLNDECGPRQETPAARWQRMRKWVADQLVPSVLDKSAAEEKNQ